MPEITATVVAKSAYGIKIEQDGEWWNWSKVEYRSEPFDTEVQKGDRVQLTYAETDGGKTYITAIGKVTRASERETKALQDEPFPPEEEFPPDEPQEASPPAEDYGQSLWAKDRLRARTDCLACATGIYKSVIEAGIYKEFPSAETVAGYAATLEEWAKRE